VQFVDTRRGWAVAQDPGMGDSGSSDAIERTTDGGATWMPQWVDNNASLAAVDFLADGTTGWAAGYTWSNGPPQAAIYASTDAGLSWKKEALRGLPGTQVAEITGLQFTDATDGWAVGYGIDILPAGSRESDYLLHTTNGGQTWMQVPGFAGNEATTVCFSDPQDGWIGGQAGVFATTDGGTTWQHVAAGDGFTALAATDPGHAWAFGYGVLASTVAADGDTAAPVTIDHDLDSAWHRKAVTVALSASDVGGSGVAATDYCVDGGPWTPGSAIVVDAPAGHGNDGAHTILYRSTDSAGNREQTERVTVGIDTLGPTCSAPRKSVIDTGKSGILRFTASDATSGVGRATISIVDAKGRVARRIVERAGNWGMEPAPAYFWLRFRCTLKPGTYRIEVRATDLAGNPQVKMGRNVLRVVRAGAPAVRQPWWPAGLPSQMGFANRLRNVLGLRWRSLSEPALASLSGGLR
jgi:hypothetical protein